MIRWSRVVKSWRRLFLSRGKPAPKNGFVRKHGVRRCMTKRFSVEGGWERHE